MALRSIDLFAYQAPDDHDDAGHGPVRATLADAVEGLDRIIEGLDDHDDA